MIKNLKLASTTGFIGRWNKMSAKAHQIVGRKALALKLFREAPHAMPFILGRGRSKRMRGGGEEEVRVCVCVGVMRRGQPRSRMPPIDVAGAVAEGHRAQLPDTLAGYLATPCRTVATCLAMGVVSPPTAPPSTPSGHSCWVKTRQHRRNNGARGGRWWCVGVARSHVAL